MTDEVQTKRYRNRESYPVFLESVQREKGDEIPSATVDAYGFADLSDEQVSANRETIDEHLIKVLEPEKEDTPTFDRTEALAKAKELGVKGGSNLRNDELQTAIIAAEEKKKEGEQS